MLHATDPAAVFLAAAARLRDPTVAAIDRALYEQRSLVRVHGMRRTLFAVPRELVPVVYAACTRGLAAGERARTVGLLSAAGHPGDIEAWLRQVEGATLAAIGRHDGVIGSGLAGEVPELAQKVVLAPGKRYSATVNLTGRVLNQLGFEGLAVRGRPTGSWTGSQYRWYPAPAWLGAPIPEIPPEPALAELVRAWLRSFGPGTEADLRWWTGLSAGAIRRAVAAVGAVPVAVDSGPALLLPEDLEPAPAPEPWVALLPGLDPTTMGWSERYWYLGPHRPALFDVNGNAGPTVWVDGRVVGGWTQRKSGEVVPRLLEDVGREADLKIAERAAELARWIGPVRVIPRFRTPLEKELAAG